MDSIFSHFLIFALGIAVSWAILYDRYRKVVAILDAHHREKTNEYLRKTVEFREHCQLWETKYLDLVSDLKKMKEDFGQQAIELKALIKG